MVNNMLHEDKSGAVIFRAIQDDYHVWADSTNDKGGKKIDLIKVLCSELDSQFRCFKKHALGFKAKNFKSSKEAIELRKKVDDTLLQGGYDHKKIWKLINQCITLATTGSKELVIAYADRALILYETRKYTPCLDNIQLALEEQCPEGLKKKLRVLKKKCLIEMKNSNDDESDPADSKTEEDAEWQELYKFGNPLIANASRKIRIAYDEFWGRHIVATEDIEPGEILSCQRMFTLTVNPEQKYEYCSYCLLPSHALIPCPGCTQMMYCSIRCRAEAYDMYHRVECKTIECKMKGEVRQVDEAKFKAMRTLLMGTEQGTRIKELMEVMTIEDIFAENVDLSSRIFRNDYKSVLTMRRTFNLRELIQNILPVAEMITVLQNVGFFDNINNTGNREVSPEKICLSDVEMFTGMLLLNHIVSVHLKGVSISMMEWLKGSGGTVIGSGVCTLHSLINHSCNPNTQFIIRDLEEVLFALRPIQKGEQIFLSSVAPFSKNDLCQRIKELHKYGITCKCEACKHQWPVNSDLQMMRMQFLSENLKQVKEELMRTIMPVTRGGIMKLSNRAIIRIIGQVCKLLHTHVKSPSIEIVNCEDLLFNVMMMAYDDFSKSLDKVVRKKYIGDLLESIMKECILNMSASS